MKNFTLSKEVLKELLESGYNDPSILDQLDLYKLLELDEDIHSDALQDLIFSLKQYVLYTKRLKIEAPIEKFIQNIDLLLQEKGNLQLSIIDLLLLSLNGLIHYTCLFAAKHMPIGLSVPQKDSEPQVKEFFYTSPMGEA